MAFPHFVRTEKFLNKPKFAHSSRVTNIDICEGLGIFSDRMAPQRPLEDFKLEAPPLTRFQAWNPGHLHAHTFMTFDEHMYHDQTHEKPLGPIPSVQKEVCRLIHRWGFVSNCHHFPAFYFKWTPPTDLMPQTSHSVSIILRPWTWKAIKIFSLSVIPGGRGSPATLQGDKKRQHRTLIQITCSTK